MADLKAEKERLVGLSREKAHADKLKGRITEISSSIATKQVEYEETKKQYEAIMEANQKFYDYASKFRDMYVKIQTLEEKKERLQSDLDDAKLNLQEVVGGFHIVYHSWIFRCFIQEPTRNFIHG